MVKMIVNDITNIIKQYTPFAVITGSLILASVCVFISTLTQTTIRFTIRSNIRKLLLLYLFYIYFFMVLSITNISRIPGSRTDVDLRLFGTISLNIYNNRYLVENVLLFIPYGILLPLIWKNFFKLTFCLLAGMILSLTIETGQWITRNGYFQLDDILLNMAGMLIGSILVKRCIILFHTLRERKNNRR